jgi:hypothetical protein
VELGGRSRHEVVVWPPIIGWRIDAGRSDVGIEHRPEFLVETLVGERQPCLEAVAELHCRATCRSGRASDLSRVDEAEAQPDRASGCPHRLPDV